MRFPLYPAVDQSIIDTNMLFGVDIVHRWVPTDADREKAARYDVKAALEKAIKDRAGALREGLNEQIANL